MRNFYIRTIKNCKTYEQWKDKKHLLNEIGALRGIAYCLELQGENFMFTDDDFLHFINKQNKLLSE